MAETVQAFVKEFDRARKGLEDLGEEEGWVDRAKRERALGAVRQAMTLKPPELGGALAELEQHAGEFVEARRRVFLDDFLAGVQAKGLAWRAVGQQPPAYELDGLQVEVDFEREEARLLYDREVLGKTTLDPKAILEARQTKLAELEGVWPGSEALFDALETAYRTRSLREGKPPGERVQLVDLLPELVIEYERRGLLAKGRRPPDRASFAYCLDRLAREGGLEQRGRRLELGTATGGSTKDKKRVLFLSSGMGGGQYYLSARVVAARGGEATT